MNARRYVGIASDADSRRASQWSSNMTRVPKAELDPQALFAVLSATIKSQALAEQRSKPQLASSNRLLTPREAGQYLGRTESAIRQMIHKRQLPVVRFGRNVRIDRLDLDKLIDEYKM